MDKFSFTSKFKLATFGITLAILASACPNRGTDLSHFYSVPQYFSEVNFATLKSTVLTPKCITCHSEFETEEGTRADVVAGDPAHSPLYTEIVNGTMPPSGPALPASSIEIVAKYIEGLNRAELPPSPSPSGSGPSGDVTYANLKKSILDSKCLRCHEEFATEEGMKEFIVPGNAEKSPLFTSTESGDMPPKKPPLTADELAMIRNYINAKAKN